MTSNHLFWSTPMGPNQFWNIDLRPLVDPRGPRTRLPQTPTRVSMRTHMQVLFICRHFGLNGHAQWLVFYLRSSKLMFLLSNSTLVGTSGRGTGRTHLGLVWGLSLCRPCLPLRLWSIEGGPGHPLLRRWPVESQLLNTLPRPGTPELLNNSLPCCRKAPGRQWSGLLFDCQLA